MSASRLAGRTGRNGSRSARRFAIGALWVALAYAPAGSRAQGTVVIPTDSLPAAMRPGGEPGLVRATSGTPEWDAVRMRVRITPASARIGQALTYRAAVLVYPGVKVRFEPPKSGGSFTWSRARAGRVSPGWWKSVTAGRDSVWFEGRLQIFEAGQISVQGPVVQLSAMPRSTRPGSARIPVAHVTILPTVTAADSTGELRALHGPLRAPWWERIGWTPIVLAMLLLAAAIALYRRLRRKRPVPVTRPAAPTPVRARIDPAAEALRALVALRARELPAAGRFSEHAFELTAILRRFLEATVTTPRPGDTSGELLERLRSARLPEDDFERLEGLLSLWDRVKFARAPLTEAEAARCEEAVEAFVRRVAQARLAATRAGVAAAPGAPSGPAPGPPAPEAA